MQKVNVFVEEYNNDEIVFATWCVGVRTRRFFYVAPVSVSNLTQGLPELLKIASKYCKSNSLESTDYTIAVDANKDLRKEEPRLQFIEAEKISCNLFAEVKEAIAMHKAG